jgi:YD repeat-containing protein
MVIVQKLKFLNNAIDRYASCYDILTYINAPDLSISFKSKTNTNSPAPGRFRRPGKASGRNGFDGPPSLVYTSSMKLRLFLTALLLLGTFSALTGQDAAAPESGLFPLSLLLDATVSGESPWRPDWPAAMPPDAFTLLSGRASALTLILPAGYLDAPPGGAPDGAGGTNETAGANGTAGAPGGMGGANGATGANGTSGTNGAAGENETAGEDGEAALEYRLVRDRAGRFAEFPFSVNGGLCQARIEYEDSFAAPSGRPEARQIILDNPAEPDPWEFEILEYRQGAPSLVRSSHGGTWSFVAPEYLETRTNETWYDAGGLAQGFFALEYRLQDDGAKRLVSLDSRSDQDERVLAYNYNSAGRISGISAPEGKYTALYNAAAQPRYWERPDGAYALQWNEQGFLVRLAGLFRDETGAAGEDRRIEVRYEYTLDERGNWIERRETSFVQRFDRLVPESSTAIRRAIHYGDNEDGEGQ